MQVLEDNVKSNRMLTVLSAYICIFYPLSDFGIGNIFGWAFLLGYWLFNVSTRRGKFHLSKYRLSYVWIALVVFVYFIMPNARNDAKSTQALVISIGIGVLYLLSARVDKGDVVRIMRIFVLVGILFSIFIILCRIFPNVYTNIILPKLRGVNTTEIIRLVRLGYGAHIANSITYGPYIISMAAFFVLGDILLKTHFYRRGIAYTIEILFIVAVLCEGRRSELVCLIIACFVVYMISTPNNAAIILKRLGVLFIILIIGVFLITFLVQHGYLTRFVNTFELLKGGLSTSDLNKLTSSRYRLWESAWSLFKSNPVFGIGWSNFSENVETRVNNVHNCYLQFLCETGIVGFIAIMIPMIVQLIKSIKNFKQFVSCGLSNDRLIGNAIMLSVGMQVFFLLLYAMDPVFYKGYYHLLHIILILLSEYFVIYSVRTDLEG